MTLNPDRCHLLVIRHSAFNWRRDDSVAVRIRSTDIVNSSEEKLLGVHIDNKLSFDICQKAGNKLYALARIPPISPYVDQSKLRTLIRSLIASQFQYCLLI